PRRRDGQAGEARRRDRGLPGAVQEHQALTGWRGAALVRAGMLEAGHRFRRVSGHLHLPRPRAAWKPTSECHCRKPERETESGMMITEAPPKFDGPGGNLV